MESLTINQFKYKAMIGVGGIGAGKFFLLDGDHNLGREESRSGRFLDTRDYCKLHIISHYVQVLLGSQFTVIPVGKVGEDETGSNLLREMKNVGMDLKYVKQFSEFPTMYAFCYVYPDGSGGNMTPNNSASSQVDAGYVSETEPEFNNFKKEGIALAAPEVPLEARIQLLEMATNYGFYRVASFTSEELRNGQNHEILRNVDLLSINLDEAAALTNTSPEKDQNIVVESAIKKSINQNPHINISITNGAAGSWCWDGSSLNHLPVHLVDVISTAGAGDAHVAGLIAGITAGLSLHQSHHLASLTGAHSVTSPHTINPDTNRKSLESLAQSSKHKIDNRILNLLEVQN